MSDDDYKIESTDAGASATIPMDAGAIKKGGYVWKIVVFLFVMARTRAFRVRLRVRPGSNWHCSLSAVKALPEVPSNEFQSSSRKVLSCFCDAAFSAK